MALAADKSIASRSGARTRATPHFVALVFFVSGFPALIYQLTWQRSLFALYGINIEAVTVVVAGFLFGLGIGSLVGGYLSLSRSVPLLALFGAIETSIGAFGVVSLHVFDFVGAYTLTLPRPEITAIVLILLFVPTLLMGSTLPVLVAYLVRRSANIGQAVGVLYCVNTASSAVACVAVAFGLDVHLAGMQGTVNIAAAINFVIGGAAPVEAYRTRHCAAADAAVTTPADRKALPEYLARRFAARLRARGYSRPGRWVYFAVVRDPLVPRIHFRQQHGIRLCSHSRRLLGRDRQWLVAGTDPVQ